MEKSCFVSRVALVFIIQITILSLSNLTFAQGIQQSPYSAPNVLRNEFGPYEPGLSNPLSPPMGGLAGRSEPGSILLSPQLFQGILPNIPYLQVGYLYSFGDNVSSGRLSLDFLQPVRLGNHSAVFAEFHNEWRDFWRTVSRGSNHRIDLSIGGGYRTIFNENTLVGVNAFYDTTRLGGAWYDSGGVGTEVAALLAGNGSIDFAFNWYGNLFNSDVLANAFRRGPENYDFSAGYSHEIWNGGPDMRLSATGYRFSSGNGVYGFKGGVELRSRDGMFTVKYEAAHDRINETYQTVGGFVNIGLQLGNLLNGESPFTSPEPIFRSPRNLKRLLTRPVANSRRTGAPNSIVTSSGADPCITRAVFVSFTHDFTDVYFASPVPFTDLAKMNTATMTIGPRVAGNATQLDRTRVDVSGSHNSNRYTGPIPGIFVATRAADPQWFGIGLPGTKFETVRGRVIGYGNTYEGTITVTWCP